MLSSAQKGSGIQNDKERNWGTCNGDAATVADDRRADRQNTKAENQEHTSLSLSLDHHDVCGFVCGTQCLATLQCLISATSLDGDAICAR